MKVADLVQENIKSLFDKDIKLVEVEYTKKSDGMHLVVYIDKEAGITIDDCVEVSRMIDPIIDDLNPTGDEQYVLDVSSYGLDKPLKYDWQFKKYLDKKVEVKLYRKIDARKEFSATLKNFNETEFVFNDGKENFTILRAKIAYITPYIEF
ncbi:MAG: ribosome maturation factor RimP [Clostridia bacterium]|nr:ribosome maturation factor RimP [Clostridia bacterium]